MRNACQLPSGGSAPATPGVNAVAPEWLVSYGAADAAPAVPAAESTLGSHPCVALSSAQLLPEWINRNLAANAFSSNGDNPLNFVSHSRGSLQFVITRLVVERAGQCQSLFSPQRGLRLRRALQDYFLHQCEWLLEDRDTLFQRFEEVDLGSRI